MIVGAGVALTMLSSAPAIAAESIAIITAVAGNTEIDAFGLYEAAATAIGYCPELAALSREAMFGTGAAAIGGRLDACGADLDCISTALTAEGVRWALELRLNAALRRPLLSVQLFDAKRRAAVSSKVAPPSEDLRAAARSTAQTVLDEAGWPASGRLDVVTKPARAQVYLQKARFEGPKLLPPGRHELRVAKDGFEDKRQTVDITAATDTDVLVQLEPAASVVESPWLWVGVAVAVLAGAGVGTFFALQSTDETYSVCQGQCP